MAKVIVNTGGEDYDFLSNRNHSLSETDSVIEGFDILMHSQDSDAAKQAFIRFCGSAPKPITDTIAQMIRLQKKGQIVRFVTNHDFSQPWTDKSWSDYWNGAAE